jgi:heptosyltransferase-3
MYPFILNLKLNLPDADITALINAGGESLLELMPELSEVITIHRKSIKGVGGLTTSLKLLSLLRAKKFDTVFILSNSDRATFIGLASGAKQRIGFVSDSWFRGLLLTKKSKWDRIKTPHFVEYNLQLLTDNGLTIYDPGIVLPLPAGLSAGLKKRFSITTGRKTVIVHPGTRGPLRNWGAANFIKVINELSDRYAIFLAGGPSEQEILDEILKGLNRKPEIITTDLNLVEFSALCSICDLFIGNDSAPIHMAAATGIYVIGIYGPTLAKHCSPWTDKKIIFDDETIPCRLCDQKQCYSDIFQECFAAIKPEMIIEKAKEILEG